jgi:hypothetical protein
MDDVPALLEVDEDVLKNRLIAIASQITSEIAALRKEVPTLLANEDLVQNKAFRRWMVANLVIQHLEEQGLTSTLGRMMYYMYEECEGNMAKLLDQYDIESDLSNSVPKFNLVVVEYGEENDDDDNT